MDVKENSVQPRAHSKLIFKCNAKVTIVMSSSLLHSRKQVTNNIRDVPQFIESYKVLILKYSSSQIPRSCPAWNSKRGGGGPVVGT